MTMNILVYLSVTLIYLHLALPPGVSALTPHSCYYDANALAADDFLPCYTTTTSTHYPCCRAGDKCLENNACYDADSGVTYQFGCTDATFSSASCPRKCGLSTAKSQWVGLVFCNGANGLPRDSWVCHHPDNCGSTGYCAAEWSDGISKKPAVGCGDLKHGKEYVAFEASWTLSDVVALPSASRTASWWAANAARYASMTSTTLTTSRSTTTMATAFTYPSRTLGMSATGSMSVATPTSTSSVPQQASSNEKAVALGAGLGIGLGIPVLLCIMSLAFFYIRRQRKKLNAANKRVDMNSADEKHAAASSGGHKSGLDSTPIVGGCGLPAASELQGPGVSPETVQEEFGNWGRDGPLRVHELSI
ncbi:hypothetical protein BDU57DRAFT_153240 [Ampelomyces quisqualis]|uniref:Mid2 domain-containing protein n=1 Tax=Ampelomyces quisqualis TaxID=50730 RepID=A0A6A5QWI8_AMPQU|nr:hypothetical protein BDU57DRAFT_153240 [Ampelomyces quisqualis]